MSAEIQIQPKSTVPATVTAKEILAKLIDVQQRIEEIARLYVSGIDSRPNLRDELREAGIADEALNRLERIGRGQMLPRLYDATFAGANSIRLLPLSQQREAIEKGVEVLGEDETTVRTIPAENLTRRQAYRVLSGGRVRSIAEQRSLIVAEKARAPQPKTSVSVKVNRDSVFVGQPGIYGKAEILGWLARMG